MPPKKDQAPIYVDGPKWISQWMMGYIQAFKTGSWSANQWMMGYIHAFKTGSWSANLS